MGMISYLVGPCRWVYKDWVESLSSRSLISGSMVGADGFHEDGTTGRINQNHFIYSGVDFKYMVGWLTEWVRIRCSFLSSL